MSKMNLRNNKKKLEGRFVVPLLSIGIVILVFILGFVIGRSGFEVAWEDGEFTYAYKGRLYPEEKEINFETFWEVWDILQEDYVEKGLDQQALFYGAVKGMVAGLEDPATRFFTSSETQEYEKDKAGELEGVGIELGYLNGSVIIKRTIENAPAQSAGLQAGDIIEKVDNEDVADSDISTIATKIRGEKGTTVQIGVQRNGDELTFDIERSSIYVKSIIWEKKEDNIVVITISRFTETNYSDFTRLWDETVQAVNDEDPSGIIIDLRGNGGGYLDAASYIAGDFLKKGTVVLYIETRDGAETPMKAENGSTFLETPLVLLVDSGTASASEIFAGAIQHYGRAVVVGEETYGKGTAQEIRDPASWGGASLHITTQKWLLPDGRWINQDNPIQPDIEVEITIEQVKQGVDPQMQRAMQEIKD